MLFAPFGQCAEWTVDPSVSASLEVNDNIALAPTNPESVDSVLTSGSVVMAVENDTGRLGVSPGFRDRQSRRSNDLDRASQYVNFDASQLFQWGGVGLDGGFRAESTLTSELESTGFVEADKRRNSLSVQPNVSYDLSEKRQLWARASYSSTDYQGEELTGLYDFDFRTVATGVSQDLADDRQVGMSLSWSRERAPTQGTETDNIALNAQYRSALSDRTTYSASLGARYTVQKLSVAGGDFDEDDAGGVYELSVRSLVTNRSSVTLAVSQSLVPSGAGVLLEQYSGTLSYGHEFEERLRCSASLGLLDTKSLGATRSPVDYALARATVGADWLLAEDWRLQGSYIYSRRDDAVADTLAFSNAVIVTVSYEWPAYTWSR